MQGDASGLENTPHVLHGSTDAIDVFQKCARQDKIDRSVWQR